MVDYALMLFKSISFNNVQATPQVQTIFAVFGLVCTVMGYWIKQVLGVIIGALIVLFIYLYITGYFYRLF